MPSHPAQPEAVLEAAAAAASALLVNGAAASEASAAASHVAAAGGLAKVTASVAYSEVAVYWRDPRERTLVAVREVPPRAFDYGRLAAVMELVDRVRTGALGPAHVAATVRRIQERPGRYPWWATRIAIGAAGGMAAVLFGGGPVVAGAAFAANLVVDWLVVTLLRRGWPWFFIQAAIGLLGVAIAAAVQALSPVSSPAVVVVAVILVALAGMTSMGAIHDAITGWYVNAAGRILEGVTNTLGLVAGVQLGLLGVHSLGIALDVTQGVALGALPLGIVLVAAALVAASFGVATQTPPAALAPAALLASGAFAAFAGSAPHVGPVWAAAAAAFAAGMAGVALAHRLRLPLTALATCAILPLLPGLQLYQGLLEVGGLAPGGGGSLVGAAATALALAAGMSFGEYCGVLVWRSLRVVVGRAFVPLFARPGRGGQ